MIFIKNKSLKVILLGPLQMIFSSICVALTSYFAKLATNTIPGSEVTFFRLGLGALVVLPMALLGSVKLVTDNFKMLIVRGFSGGMGILFLFIALEKGTITNSVVLQYTYPLFALLLSIYVLKEKASKKLIAFMLITFSGIVILIRPEIGNIRIGKLFALASGLLGGFAITAIRQLRRKNESVWTIFFYFCFFGAILALIVSIPIWRWPQLKDYVLLILTALFGLLGQVTLTSAYKYCNAIVGGILSMSTCIFSLALGVVFLNEQVGVAELLGILLIIAGNVLVFISQHQEQKQ